MTKPVSEAFCFLAFPVKISVFWTMLLVDWLCWEQISPTRRVSAASCRAGLSVAPKPSSTSPKPPLLWDVPLSLNLVCLRSWNPNLWLLAESLSFTMLPELCPLSAANLRPLKSSRRSMEPWKKMTVLPAWVRCSISRLFLKGMCLLFLTVLRTRLFREIRLAHLSFFFRSSQLDWSLIVFFFVFFCLF